MELKKLVWSLVAVITVLLTGFTAQAGDGNLNGTASYYHPKFVGRKTATGEIFSNSKYTAACNKYKLGTFVKVTNVKNGKSVYVKVNDRIGHPKRVIDLTHRAASDLKFVNSGLTTVKIEVVSPEEGKRKILAQTSGQGLSDNEL